MSHKKIIGVLLLVLGIMVILGPEAIAAEQEGESLLKLISYGGGIGYFTILLNFIGIGLAIEHFINIRRDVVMPPEVLQQVEEMFEDGEYEEAMAICESQPNYFTRVCGAGIAKIGHSFPVVEKAMEEMGDEESIKLHQKVGWLALIANVAPMMGLLGTVGGMVEAFNEIAASSGGANPAQLASGISKALLTTMFGLIVALPVTAAFAFIRNRMVRNIIEVGAIVEDLFEHFRDEAN